MDPLMAKSTCLKGAARAGWPEATETVVAWGWMMSWPGKAASTPLAEVYQDFPTTWLTPTSTGASPSPQSFHEKDTSPVGPRSTSLTAWPFWARSKRYAPIWTEEGV